MLKFFYRLKRQRGVVLFMVIAIMTLLIAMATTAYMTARASYKTVVSNYDYSQMYLSAISMSDLLVDCITLDTTRPTENVYSDFKSALEGIEGTEGASITVYSKNIAAHSSDSDEQKALIASDDPILSGALDGLEVTANYLRDEDDVDASGLPTGLKRYYFELQTTAYYRGSTITVSDIVYHKSGTKQSQKFDTFFTATGNKNGGVDTSRMVGVSLHDVTDDVYFENEYTYIYTDNASNKLSAGLSTIGNLYIGKLDTGISSGPATGTEYYKQFDATNPDNRTGDGSRTYWSDRSDWFVGGDLVVTNNCGIDLKGSNMYINGDLVLCEGAVHITAGDIYVNGNVYITSTWSDTIDANIYINGNVFTNINDSTQVEATGTKAKSTDPGHLIACYNDTHESTELVNSTSSKSIADLPVINATSSTISNQNNWANNGKQVYVKGNDYTHSANAHSNTSWPVADPIVFSTKNVRAKLDVSKHTPSGTDSRLVGTNYAYNISSENKNENTSPDMFVERGDAAGTKLTDLYKDRMNKQTYDNYTAKQTTLNNVLTIDFDELKSSSFPKVEAWAAGKTYPSADGKTVFVGYDHDGNITDDQSAWETIYLVLDAALDNDYSYPPQPCVGTIKGGKYISIKPEEFDASKSAAYYEQQASVMKEWYDGDTSYKRYTKKLDPLDDPANPTMPKVWDSGTTKAMGAGNSAEYYVMASGTETTVKATVTKTTSTTPDYTVNLPYYAGGYVLKLLNVPNGGGTQLIEYNIGTKASEFDATTGKVTTNNTLPIVLAANFNDGSTDPVDENGNNAFSWRGNKLGSSSSAEKTRIQLVKSDANGNALEGQSADGCVIMEVGNFDKTTKQYVRYDGTNPNIFTPTYYDGQKFTLGTYNQVQKIEGNWQSDITSTPWTDMLKGNTPYPKDGYENQFVLVSNKDSGIAYSGKTIDHTLCGYVYAPNSTFDCFGRGGASIAVFGGMIVSYYYSDLDFWVYCAPNPTLIDMMLDGLNKKSADNDVDMWESASGKDYLG